MSHAAGTPAGGTQPARPVRTARFFRATLGVYEDPAARATIDDLTRWVETTYRDDLQRRPSKHVYTRKLPPEVIVRIDELRNHPVVHSAILRQFDADWVLTPMKHTDELYISHYNMDAGGDQGLYSKHYDGNLRFVPFGAVVRALIYLQSDATYRVVFGDSRVERAFATYEFGLLDFHRELHWVEGEYDPSDRQRILLKCNYLVAPRGATLAARALLAANTGVFYIVKAAMEYSKSPRTPVQRFVGLLCNLMRVLNIVHPLVPIALILAVIACVGWVLLRLTG